MKPKLRKEAQIDLEGGIKGAIWSMMLRNDIFPFQNCLNCTHFTENTMFCKLANQRPPAKIIAYGCEHHTDISDVPF